jgi:hypothetical protein
MTRAQILARFPNASHAVLSLADDNHNPTNPGAPAKLERPTVPEPLAAGKAQEEGAGRVHLCIVSVRKRLLDPDNISPKWLIDCLRYCHAIRGDEPDKITLETTQRKTAKGEEEHTLITITYPEP